LLSRLAREKKAQLPGGNEHFFDKYNEESGHYGQTLSNSNSTGYISKGFYK